MGERWGTGEGDTILGLFDARLGIDTSSGASIVYDELFDVHSFDEHDGEQPRGTDGEIVLRPTRAGLPRSPVGRVLERELRDEGVTAATWDADASGIEYERR